MKDFLKLIFISLSIIFAFVFVIPLLAVVCFLDSIGDKTPGEISKDEYYGRFF